MRSATTGEWKREANEGHRAGVSARWKKMITSTSPGQETISRKGGKVILEQGFGVSKKWKK